METTRLGERHLYRASHHNLSHVSVSCLTCDGEQLQSSSYMTELYWCFLFSFVLHHSLMTWMTHDGPTFNAMLQSCFMLIFTNALLSMHKIPFIWDLTFVVFTHSSLNNSLLFSAMMSLCRARIRTSGASWWQSGPRGQRQEYQDKRWQRGNTSLAINLQCC